MNCTSIVKVYPRVAVTNELIIPLGEINQIDSKDPEIIEIMDCEVIKSQNFEYRITCSVIKVVLIKPNIKLVLKPLINMEKIEDVKVLELSQHVVHYLPINLGELFGNLTRLYASGCHLKELKRANLKGLKNLEYMSLWMNDLETLPDDVFDDLINMKTLNLQGNKIKKIPEDIFQSLTKLQNVNLSRNKIRFIPAYLFTYNVDLENISLNDNLITYVSPRLLITLKKLKTCTFLRNTGINEEAIRQRDIIKLKAYLKLKFRNI